MLLVRRFITVTLCVTLVACVTSFDKPKRVVDKQGAVASNVQLGMTYLQQGARDRASRAFLKALDMDPNAAEAHQGMAILHQLNGEFEASEKRFKKALKTRSDFSKANIHFSYGRFLLEQDRLEDALVQFQAAGKEISYSRRAEAQYFVGRTQDALGRPKVARAAYEYALNLDERYAPAALEMAEIYFNEGEYARSKRFLDSYARNSKQSSRSLWLGIRIERIFGNKDKEASYALALKNLHPYSKEYLEYKRLTER